MIDIEQEVREAFAARTATPPLPVGLTDRVIANASTVRRRRATATVATAVVAVLVIVSATLPRVLHKGTGVPPASQSQGAYADYSAVLARLPIGKPPALAVFGPASVRRQDGTMIALNLPNGEFAAEVHQAAGAWVVLSDKQDRERGVATMVRDDSSVKALSNQPVAVALAPNGDRVAVQSESDGKDRVDVFALPAGDVVASTALPDDGAHSVPMLTGWSGSLVTLAAAADGSSTGAADVWDPDKGSYQPSPVANRMVIGPSDRPGQVLALEPGPAPSGFCLLRADVAARYATTAGICDLDLSFGTAELSSPDGRNMIVWRPDSSHMSAIDVNSAFAGGESTQALDLPPGIDPLRVWWEDTGAVLVNPVPHGGGAVDRRLDLLRCRVDGSPCELAPVPEVDGGPAWGLVQR